MSIIIRTSIVISAFQQRADSGMATSERRTTANQKITKYYCCCRPPLSTSVGLFKSFRSSFRLVGVRVPLQHAHISLRSLPTTWQQQQRCRQEWLETMSTILVLSGACAYVQPRFRFTAIDPSYSPPAFCPQCALLRYFFVFFSSRGMYLSCRMAVEISTYRVREILFFAQVRFKNQNALNPSAYIVRFALESFNDRAGVAIEGR